jgi:rhodanese-related sulfurtransferase
MRAIMQAAGLTAGAVTAATITWLITGGVDRSVPCDPDRVEEGSMCLSTIQESGGDVLWIDARPRSLWKRNGLPGSILLTDDAAEDWDDLLAAAGERLVMAELVVVYCGQEGCGSSKAVAAGILESGLAREVEVLFGGWRALYAAGLTDSR